MKAKIKFKGRILEIPEIKKASGLNKFLGLMFKSQETKALLFEFEKPVKQAIHSFFCPDFLAIWLNGSKIVDYKLITGGKFSIKPKAEFTKLLEIPINNKYSLVTKFFIVG